MGCCSERKDDSPCYDCLLEAFKRVRELANELLECDCKNTCEFKVAGMSINKALDGEQS